MEDGKKEALDLAIALGLTLKWFGGLSGDLGGFVASFHSFDLYSVLVLFLFRLLSCAIYFLFVMAGSGRNFQQVYIL